MKQLSAGVYDNAFHHNNVYGHTLALLRQQQIADRDGKVHLDIGCGYGRIAEPLSADLGMTYVGADGADDGLASLRSRGFEVHSLWLDEEEATHQALRRIVGTRRVGSISILDTLEHLADGDAVLRAISRLALEHAAFVVISVPNIAHSDIGFKLAFGRWDYTESGLLDHTHLRLFDAASFDRTLQHAGLFTIATKDVLMRESDQHFPPTHPALAHGTYLHAYLQELRRAADGNWNVNQFVRICVAAAPSTIRPYRVPSHEPTPFLSVVVRTQGRRPHTLDEVLTALAGQTDTDFEVLVMGHRLSPERQIMVERILEDSPEWLRRRCRLMLVDDGNRTRPLNVGFAAAKGDYMVILDDDDLPFAHWVETFHTLAAQQPGRLLRAVAVRQDVKNVTIHGRLGLRAVGAPEKIFPSTFEYLAHLRVNQTPGLSIAFPRGVFHDLGWHFDETLTTTEDWDYIMRVAGLVGTACSPEITAIYRWWHQDESSRSLHAKVEWDRNHSRIFQKLDDSIILFPTGTTAQLRFLLDHYDRTIANQNLPAPAAIPDRVVELCDVVTILNSTCWRITWPLRLLSRLMGNPNPRYDNIWNCDRAELVRIATALRRSRSWRVTAPLRRLLGG